MILLPFLCSVVHACVAYINYSEMTPPRITRTLSCPGGTVYINRGVRVRLPCQAEGNPQPSFKITRNGEDFSSEASSHQVFYGNDSVTIMDFSQSHEGLYQCSAENDFGTSVSPPCQLRAALLEPFPVVRHPRQYRVRWGMPLTLKCVPPRSSPESQVTWVIVTTNNNNDDDDEYFEDFGFGQEFKEVELDDRVTMDRNYRLRFAYVEQSDAGQYVCKAVNSVARAIIYGYDSVVQVTGDFPSFTTARYVWSDPSDLIGVQGDPFDIQCIFSGNPVPAIEWTRSDSQPLDNPRVFSDGQKLVFTNFTVEDSGKYICRASSVMGIGVSSSRTFNLQVKARPYFTHKPEPVEATSGESAEFHCTAGGDPEPEIIWTFNGLTLTDYYLQRNHGNTGILNRIEIFDHRTVIISHVTQGDHVMIQCNATNIYGYQFAEAYLKVL